MSCVSVRFYLAVFTGRVLQSLLRLIGKSAGGTWPGEIALILCPNFISCLNPKSFRLIVVAGTNGKTTSGKMIQTILSKNSFTVRLNETGANLMNGLVSVFLSHPLVLERPIVYVFEVDEASLPHALSAVSPDVLVLLNLFRDQLDRYGEIRSVVALWKKSIEILSPKTTVIANADDPSIAYIAGFHSGTVQYFGLEDPLLFHNKKEHAADSLYCPKCFRRLTYQGLYYSHLGIWTCGNCGNTHPDISLRARDVKSPLDGNYNIYNTLAATGASGVFGISSEQCSKALLEFSPAFGRMESIVYKNRKITILLSKNPTGFNQSLRVALEHAPSTMLFVLNDRIPDGTDVSWIYDVDFEQISEYKSLRCVVSGDLVFDMALRLQYAGVPLKNIFSYEILKDAIEQLVNQENEGAHVWILATYSAMLETRKILTGKKI
ncbi:MAG: Mur ligase family protein [Patescibacteria group bacterium]